MLKNENAAGKDEVTGEVVKGGGDVIVDWIWTLCDMAFESDVLLEDLMSSVIVPLHKDKGEMIKCKTYIGISLLSVVGKIYADILVDGVRRVTGGLIDDEQGKSRERVCRSDLRSNSDI